MIGLFIILLVTGGSLIFSVVLMLGVMFWTGRLALPGSEANKLHNARNQTKIAELESERAEFRFRTAQAEANRQLLEARNTDELQQMHDAYFKRELESGEARNL